MAAVFDIGLFDIGRDGPASPRAPDQRLLAAGAGDVGPRGDVGLSADDAAGRRLSRRALLSGAAAVALSAAPTGWAGQAAMGTAEAVEAAPSSSEAGRGEIWDGHVHLSGVSGEVEERVDQLLEYADRLGIARLVLFLATPRSHDPAPEEVRHENDQVLRAIRHAPNRVLGMAYLNPKHGQASLAELNRCVQDGPMVGVKLWVALRCSRPELDPLVRRAVELQVPVLQHAYDRTAGNLPGESSCADVAALAARHPEASFICAHTGSHWEHGIRAIRASRNVWAEVSGSDPTAGFVEMAVRELGPERVIFGSDAGGRSFASQLAKVLGADISDDARRRILGANLRGLLRAALDRKGATA